MFETPFGKVVVVTKKTAMEELVERFNSREQARFYVEHMGASFGEYEAADAAYHAAASALRKAVPRGFRSHWIDRAFLPTYTFDRDDLVVTLGPDGLVVNAAKYLDRQPVLAINPDPSRVDGVLVPFPIAEAGPALDGAIATAHPVRDVTMAEAALNDGQTLLAVNDLFVGQKTHVSARYVLKHDGREESQSSSGVIVSTGAGSTGWYRSVLAGAAGVVEGVRAGSAPRRALARLRDDYRFPWDAPRLVFSVREPFVSKTSSAGLVFGAVDGKRPLEIVSQMPQNGVIFSDGVEEDHLDFNSGAIARVGVSGRKLRLMVPYPAFGVPVRSPAKAR